MKKFSKFFAYLIVLSVVFGLIYCQQQIIPLEPEGTPEVTADFNAALAKADAGGRVFVVFDGKPDPAVVENAGGKVVYNYNIVPAIAATGPGAMISQIAAHPRVVRVEPDRKVYAIDAELDDSWGVKHIGAGTVHDGGNKGAGVKVGILDSGIDYTHPDLDDNYVTGYDFVNDDNNPMDDYGHGTHVAGTLAAEDNGSGVVGVAPEASLYALKVLDADGGGYVSDVVAGIDWCVDNEIDVISMSLGGGYSELLENACNAAYGDGAGVLLVASAGNSGNPPGRGDNVEYPARFESVIAVAATDNSDNRARWSSTGPAVELAAPGVNIYSTIPGGEYGYKSGTSMSCPHVAGTAALVIAAGIADVRTQLQTTADDLGASGQDPLYGFGLVNAKAAVGAVTPPPVLVSIEVTPAEASIEVGSTQQFTATGTYEDESTADITSEVTWVSSNTSVATIEAGLATGLSEGTTDITANSNGKESNTATLTVTAPPDLVSIAVLPDVASIEVGSTQQFTATGNYSDGSTKDITSDVIWVSSNTEVATIEAGLATGESVGTAYITADLDGVTSKQAVLTVTPTTIKTILIESIIPSAERKGRSSRYDLYGTYTIVADDVGGSPVEGATVYVRWILPDGVMTGSGDTDSKGEITFVLEKASFGEYTMTADDVVEPGFKYNPDIGQSSIIFTFDISGITGPEVTAGNPPSQGKVISLNIKR